MAASANRNVAQIEEELALSSIYGNEFQVVSHENSETVWKINIYNDDNVNCSLILQIHLPDKYPEEQPPIYELSSDFLSDGDLRNISKHLDELWKENEGECIVYHWVEKCREIIDEKCANEPAKIVNFATNQTQDDDDLHVNDIDIAADFLAWEEHKSIIDTKMKQDDLANSIEIISGEPIVDRKSTFQAHLGHISKESEVNVFMNKLKENRKILRASHNIMAYRIEGSQKGSYIQDNDDDGENEAGGRLMHLLQILDVKNIIVVVSRWYGGILLGPDRFKHINNCARELIVKTGFTDSNETKRKTENSKARKK